MTELMPVDKVVTKEGVGKVEAAEVRNNPGTGVYPGGVAASVGAAAKLNEGRQI